MLTFSRHFISISRTLALLLFCGLWLHPAASAVDEPPQLTGSDPLPLKGVDETRKDIAEMRRWIALQQKTGQLSASQEERFRRILGTLDAQQNQTLRTAHEKKQIATLLQTLQQKVVHNRKARRPREELAAFHAMLGEYDKALTYLRNLGPASPTDLNHFIRLMNAYSQLGDFKSAARQLAEIERLLAPRVPLRLSTPELATSIQAYRLYTPTSRRALTPGKLVLVYVEIDGAAFQQQRATSQAAYELVFKLEIKDNFQQLIDSKTFPPYKLTFQGPIRDLHASLPLRPPANLADGEYHILITCLDKFAEKGTAPAISGTDFTIGTVLPAKKPRLPTTPPGLDEVKLPPKDPAKIVPKKNGATLKKWRRHTAADLDPDDVDLRRSAHALPNAKNRFD